MNEGRTKAEFKALRESVGLAQIDVAEQLDINIRTVKRWENPNVPYMPIQAAWDMLDRAKRIQKAQIDHARETVENCIDTYGEAPHEVHITYYRDQAMYDRFGRDEGPFGQANANARAVAYELESWDITVRFDYPDEDNTAPEGMFTSRTRQ